MADYCIGFISLLPLSQIYLRWEERPALTSAQHAIASEFPALWERIRAGPWWGVHNGRGRRRWWQRQRDSPTKTRFGERQDQTPLGVQRDPVSSVKKNVKVLTLASSFPKSFPQSFLSFFLTTHFADCYYSKVTGLFFFFFALGIDNDNDVIMRRILAVTGVKAGWADLHIRWQLRPGRKTEARSTPLTEKESDFTRRARKKCRAKEMQRLPTPTQQESTRKTSVPPDNLPFLFPLIFLFHFLSCQSESSGLLTIWVPTQEAGCSFLILKTINDKCSQLKEPKEAF